MSPSSAKQPVQKGAGGTGPLDLALHASEILLSTTTTTQIQHQDSQPERAQHTLSTPPPLMHFPHCRLEITTFPQETNNPSAAAAAKLEQIALPGPLVRTLLSRFESSSSSSSSETALSQQQPQQQSQKPTTSRQQQQQQQQRGGGGDRKEKRTTTKGAEVQIQRHFDDADDWVFSRCLLADFTGFGEDEAEVMSSQGRLCCWASVVLQPPQGAGGREGEDQDEDKGKWELGFVVQRVGVRDPGSGWCECF
ncbi:hypothetical protein C8A00DRAFT_19636 [Chaetomidium leptoderma]|uniref:Uncharacterized protein n=1 Tax=Chaetomidium leptoderma TaxID=669021 RepID=A0AAN6VCI4_9PEZI|nr:hypothetical protein C8A00DRAFT_19636 [Chaetomidium leptoderma]